MQRAMLCLAAADPVRHDHVRDELLAARRGHAGEHRPAEVQADRRGGSYADGSFPPAPRNAHREMPEWLEVSRPSRAPPLVPRVTAIPDSGRAPGAFTHLGSLGGWGWLSLCFSHTLVSQQRLSRHRRARGSRPLPFALFSVFPVTGIAQDHPRKLRQSRRSQTRKQDRCPTPTSNRSPP